MSSVEDGNGISVVLITSPFPSMPALTLINSTLDSLKHVIGIDSYIRHTFILMDGFKFAAESRFKKGRISESQVELYDQYHEVLCQTYGIREHISVLRSSEHLGFAMMVKWGLELCKTKYALIMQHDRYFRQSFDRLPLLLRAFEEHENIRYIGFTTIKSHKHDLLLRSSYHIEYLTSEERIPLDGDLSLQPLIFWFDSQHLAHVQRYLQIFQPLRAISEPLRSILPKEQIKMMVLRRGDFIEDRFGQAQRNLFMQWQKDGRSSEDIRMLFRWFGSYLCWQLESAEVLPVEGPSAQVMVSHLHGRSLDLAFLDNIAATYGVDRIASRQHRHLVGDATTASGEIAAIEEESFAQLRIERRRQQKQQLDRLLHEAGVVKEDAEALGEAMQLLQFDADT